MTLVSKAYFLDNAHENLTSKDEEGMLIAHQQSASSYFSLLQFMLGRQKKIHVRSLMELKAES
jgi:HEPN domain-containing protein